MTNLRSLFLYLLLSFSFLLNFQNKSTSPKLKEKPPKKCVPNDYTFWDKFDADSEVLKMDLEEERIAERKAVEKKQQEEDHKMNVKQSLEEERAIHKRLKDLNSNPGSGKFTLL